MEQQTLQELSTLDADQETSAKVRTPRSPLDRVADYVNKKKITTIGEISRKFPEYQRTIIGLLESLKTSGRVHWDEYRPLPTLVYPGTSPDKTLKYDWSKRKAVPTTT